MRPMTPEEIVAAYRQERVPDSETQARNWEAVADRIAAGERPQLPRPPAWTEPEETPAAPAGPDQRQRRWIGVALVALAAAAVLAAMLPWQATRVHPESPAVPNQAVDRANDTTERHSVDRVRARVTPPTPPVVDALPSEPPTPVASPPRPEPAARAAKPKRAAPPEPTDAESMSNLEIKLVARAKQALDAGEPQRALAATKRHAEQFPAGSLGQERFITAVAALCALGREPEAASEARRYQAAFPRAKTAAVLVARPCREVR